MTAEPMKPHPPVTNMRMSFPPQSRCHERAALLVAFRVELSC
jgi:hypothetical protein